MNEELRIMAVEGLGWKRFTCFIDCGCSLRQEGLRMLSGASCKFVCPGDSYAETSIHECELVCSLSTHECTHTRTCNPVALTLSLTDARTRRHTHTDVRTHTHTNFLKAPIFMSGIKKTQIKIPALIISWMCSNNLSRGS